MTRGALFLTLTLTLVRVLAVPATPTPVFQPLPQNCPQTTPSPGGLETPTTTWGYPSPRPRLSPRIALSLDVPMGLLQILLEQARTRAAKERAAANARVLAQVGRR